MYLRETFYSLYRVGWGTKAGEIVLLAKERNLDIIALTDHNTVRVINKRLK